MPITRQNFMKRCPQCGKEYPDQAEFCQLDGSRLDPDGDDAPLKDPYLGQVLFGQFEVEKVLGSGGMGTVYRARQREIDRAVAVKILHPEFVRDPDVVHRFKREARLASRIENPHLVTVYSFGELPDGNFCLVMEFLDGRHLGDVLQADGPLPPGRVAHILGQVGDAVGEAHALGIVHRDLKPENVMIVKRSGDPDFVKVLDFGIAKQIDARSLATQHGLVFGTARYISPEGARGEVATSRSDVYSLGVIAFELLSGVPPFDAASAMQLLLAHVQDAPPPLRSKEAARDVPEALANLVDRCLAKTPEDRPENGAAFAEAIRAAVGVGRPSRGAVEVRRSAPSRPSVRSSATSTPRPTVRATPMPRADSEPPTLPTSRGRWVGVGLVAAAVVGLVVFLVTRGPGSGAEMSRLMRRAELAFSEGRIGEPDGAIALTEEALRKSPDLPAALDLRSRMALALLEEARQAEREGRVAAAVASLRLYERIRSDDESARALRVRLEATLATGEVPVGELPPHGEVPPTPSTTTPRVAPPPGKAIVEVQPARVVAGDPVTLVALATGFDGVPVTNGHFHIRLAGRGGGAATTVEAAPAGRPNEYTGTHVFAVEGRYEVAFASHVGRRHVDGATIVLVSARTAPPPPEPVTSAPPPETSAPPPETSAPPPETSAPEPETSAPPPDGEEVSRVGARLGDLERQRRVSVIDANRRRGWRLRVADPVRRRRTLGGESGRP